MSNQDEYNVRNEQVWYAKCPNSFKPIEHWLVFHKDTGKRLNAQCRFCGPGVMVKIDNVKKGFVHLSESDAGFTTKEPMPDEAQAT